MKGLSTYELLGIPDAVATALVLIALSLMLAPWFGGLELGPLKVPKLTDRPAKFWRFGTPLVFLIALAGFFPAWIHDERVSSKNDLNELALRWLEKEFGQSIWDGGDVWGEVSFEPNGLVARYSNREGRTGGGINILGGDFSGSGYVLFTGDWKQDDGKNGELELLVSGYGNEAQVRWGPDNSITNSWKRITSSHDDGTALSSGGVNDGWSDEGSEDDGDTSKPTRPVKLSLLEPGTFLTENQGTKRVQITDISIVWCHKSGEEGYEYQWTEGMGCHDLAENGVHRERNFHPTQPDMLLLGAGVSKQLEFRKMFWERFFREHWPKNEEYEPPDPTEIKELWEADHAWIGENHSEVSGHQSSHVADDMIENPDLYFCQIFYKVNDFSDKLQTFLDTVSCEIAATFFLHNPAE